MASTKSCCRWDRIIWVSTSSRSNWAHLYFDTNYSFPEIENVFGTISEQWQWNIVWGDRRAIDEFLGWGGECYSAIVRADHIFDSLTVFVVLYLKIGTYVSLHLVVLRILRACKTDHSLPSSPLWYAKKEWGLSSTNAQIGWIDAWNTYSRINIHLGTGRRGSKSCEALIR